ncbi:MAG: phosphoglycerate mutase family protein, partial [Bryobacteraceae bacterium]
MRAYLIRHGQAGPRDDYDRLSELGKRQAQALGRHFRSTGVRFKAALAGSMRRQQETAAIAIAEMADAPALEVDPRWNEFS